MLKMNYSILKVRNSLYIGVHWKEVDWSAALKEPFSERGIKVLTYQTKT